MDSEVPALKDLEPSFASRVSVRRDDERANQPLFQKRPQILSPTCPPLFPHLGTIRNHFSL
jgi:hypothetical protein